MKTEWITIGEEVSPRVAALILQVRDALALKDYDEAYHLLYQIVSPDFNKVDPWRELEALNLKR